LSPTPIPDVQAELRLAFAQAAVLGEGVQWHAASGRWWWTDIESAKLYAWTPGQASALSCGLPERLGCFAHTRSGKLLLGLAKSLCLGTLADLQAVGSVDMRLQPLASVEASEPRTRINDGRTDRRGYFVFGGMNEVAGERAPIAGFYQYSMRHGLRRLALPPVAIANSICFSLDGRTLYFCDSRAQLIQQCDYDAESAQVSQIRPFARMADTSAWPDGSVIDAEGCLWNAQWGAARVLRYAPDGRELQRYSVPVPQPSCPALGGAQLDQLLVTTARENLSPEALLAAPASGSLFGLALPRALALPDTLFDDETA